MTRPSTHSNYENSTPSGIHQVHGTLFLLAILSDEDDAASLRTDLNRSQLSNYKLQQCRSLEEGITLSKACGFDLVFISLDEYESAQTPIEQLQQAGLTEPIIALASKRHDTIQCGFKPHGIDEIIKKEDMTPSLVEHVTRSVIEKHSLAAHRENLREQLQLALNAGELGAWSFHGDESRFELDPISSTMFGFSSKPSLLSIDEALENVYPEDRSLLRDSLETTLDNKTSMDVAFRLNGDSMPLTRIELKGKTRCSEESGICTIIGVCKEQSQNKDLFERMVEANTEIQAALSERERTLKEANQKLMALATEFEKSNPQPNNELSLTPQSVEENPIEDSNHKAKPPEEPITSTPAKTESKKKKHSQKPLAKGSDAATENAADPVSSNKPKLHLKTKKAAEADAPDTRESNKEESLDFDKQAVINEVKRSVPSVPDIADLSQSMLFDFSREPLNDYSQPDPGKEGFIGAAKRLVANSRKGHDLDVSLSVGDQKAIEIEKERELIFQVLNELLVNVVKHAKATMCIISLFRDEDEWVLQVEDDGIGINDKLKAVNAPLNNFGLIQIRTKLATVGGHLDMAPASPSGLVARARLPVSVSDRSRA